LLSTVVHLNYATLIACCKYHLPFCLLKTAVSDWPAVRAVALPLTLVTITYPLNSV